MKKNNLIKNFPGFPDPYQSWNFPNVINGYVRTLTGGEFKVLWYIIRHTYGWQKTEDAIDLTQFEEGIRKKNGDMVDGGTGLSRKTIIRSIQGLERKGFIIAKRTKGGRGLDYTNKYAPKLQAVSKGNCLQWQKETANSVKNPPTIVNSPIFNKTTNDVVLNKLTDYGFPLKKAKDIINSYPLEKINVLLEETDKNPRIKNRAGFFLTALRNDWDLREKFYTCEYGYKHLQGEECGHGEEAKYKKFN